MEKYLMHKLNLSLHLSVIVIGVSKTDVAFICNLMVFDNYYLY
jgi:hypothetical protein